MGSKWILGLAGLVLLGWSFSLGAEETGRASGDLDADSYYNGIESYFKATPEQVLDLSHHVSDAEIPIVLFMAQRAGVETDAVLSVHASGLTWMQAAWYFKLNPWIFYTPLPPKALEKTPYEKAYAYYRNRGKKVDLKDEQIEDLVNLKFISEQYGCPPEDVVRMRASGDDFRQINDHYANRKDNPGWDVTIPDSGPKPTPSPGTGSTHRGGHHRGGGMGGAAPPPATDGN